MSRELLARQLVADCETRVRGLIAEALAAREYDEIARLVSIAASLSMLLAQQEGAPDFKAVPTVLDGAQPQTPLDTEHGQQQVPAKTREQRTRTAVQYPRFERQGERLIKIGWSKKERSKYEHRTTREVVNAVAAKLTTSVGKEGCLRMEEVLPVELSDGSDVPSYQAYLVLAWLRDNGTVLRQGNDGYKLVAKHVDQGLINKLWQETLERE